MHAAGLRICGILNDPILVRGAKTINAIMKLSGDLFSRRYRDEGGKQKTMSEEINKRRNNRTGEARCYMFSMNIK